MDEACEGKQNPTIRSHAEQLRSSNRARKAALHAGQARTMQQHSISRLFRDGSFSIATATSLDENVPQIRTSLPIQGKTSARQLVNAE